MKPSPLEEDRERSCPKLETLYSGATITFPIAQRRCSTASAERHESGPIQAHWPLLDGREAIPWKPCQSPQEIAAGSTDSVAIIRNLAANQKV